MTIHEYPRLCGGTFFTLVLQALRQRMKAREHYDGDSDGLSDPEVLVGLIKVINPDYTDPGKENLKGTANNYKACKTSNSTYLPFDDEQVISAFDAVVETDYESALQRMNRFINSFLDLGESIRKDMNLVRALVDLIQKDQSIYPCEEFVAGPNGEKIKKAALGDLKEICLTSFLLGVWHYVVVNRKDNSVGRVTYDTWCPQNGRAVRKYTANMGEGVLVNLSVYCSDLNDENGTAQEFDAFIEPEIVEEIPTQSQLQQTVNNPFVFNFTQNGNNNTQIGYIGNYYAGKKEDENGGK